MPFKNACFFSYRHRPDKGCQICIDDLYGSLAGETSRWLSNQGFVRDTNRLRGKPAGSVDRGSSSTRSPRGRGFLLGSAHESKLLGLDPPMSRKLQPASSPAEIPPLPEIYILVEGMGVLNAGRPDPHGVGPWKPAPLGRKPELGIT